MYHDETVKIQSMLRNVQSILKLKKYFKYKTFWLTIWFKSCKLWYTESWQPHKKAKFRYAIL